MLYETIKKIYDKIIAGCVRGFERYFAFRAIHKNNLNNLI